MVRACSSLFTRSFDSWIEATALLAKEKASWGGMGATAGEVEDCWYWGWRDAVAVRVVWRLSWEGLVYCCLSGCVVLDIDEPAMAPTADCCCRGLAGDVKVRRHSRHTLAGRSDSLVIARSSDMAMIAVDDCKVSSRVEASLD